MPWVLPDKKPFGYGSCFKSSSSHSTILSTYTRTTLAQLHCLTIPFSTTNRNTSISTGTSFAISFVPKSFALRTSRVHKMAPTSSLRLSIVTNTNTASLYWGWSKRLELRRSVKVDKCYIQFYLSSYCPFPIVLSGGSSYV